MSSLITLTRDKEFANTFRDYQIIVDSKMIGKIGSGETKSFPITAGRHEIVLKIDGAGSDTVFLNIDDNQAATFQCGSNLRGFKILLAQFYYFFSSNKYLRLEQLSVEKMDGLNQPIIPNEGDGGETSLSIDSIFNIGYVLLLAAIIIRWLVIRKTGIEFTNIDSMAEWEQWFYGFSLSYFFLAFWNTFLRRRCSECGATDIDHYKSKEIDRWVGIKTVKEKLSNGKYREKKLNVTYVKTENFYKCETCNHKWSEINQHEK